jgi:multiple sugar transport system permease protein
VTIFPLFFALKNSFFFWNLQMGPEPLGFIGFGNYQMALTSSVFTASLVNTLVLTVSGTVLEVLLGLAIALLLCHALPGMSVARALLIMPTTIAPIVVGFLFRYMYDPTGGLIPWLLTAAGLPIPKVGLLGSGATALPSILFADMWQWTPFCAIVLYAALLSVPQHVIEAAVARFWRQRGRCSAHPAAVDPQDASSLVMSGSCSLHHRPVLVLTRGGPARPRAPATRSISGDSLLQYRPGQRYDLIIVIMVNCIIGSTSYSSLGLGVGRAWPASLPDEPDLCGAAPRPSRLCRPILCPSSSPSGRCRNCLRGSACPPFAHPAAFQATFLDPGTNATVFNSLMPPAVQSSSSAPSSGGLRAVAFSVCNPRTYVRYLGPLMARRSLPIPHFVPVSRIGLSGTVSHDPDHADHHHPVLFLADESFIDECRSSWRGGSARGRSEWHRVIHRMRYLWCGSE